MAWNEPGGNNKDPWNGKGNDQGPPDLDEVVKKLQDKLGGLFGGSGGGSGSGSSNSGSNNTGNQQHMPSTADVIMQDRNEVLHRFQIQDNKCCPEAVFNGDTFKVEVGRIH